MTLRYGEWKTSSEANNRECVDVYRRQNEIMVRHSTGEGGMVHFSDDEWRKFLNGVKTGEFDLE